MTAGLGGGGANHAVGDCVKKVVVILGFFKQEALDAEEALRVEAAGNLVEDGGLRNARRREDGRRCGTTGTALSLLNRPAGTGPPGRDCRAGSCCERFETALSKQHLRRWEETASSC